MRLKGVTLKFNKDGTGHFNYSNELAQYLENIFHEEQINAHFTYHFSENTIYFIFDNVEGLAFDFEWEKDKIMFNFSESNLVYDFDPTTSVPIGTETYLIQFNCEKI